MKADPKFLEMVLHLSESQKERLLSRMKGKLPRRLLKDKIDIDEALAMQLEIEDEQLQDWRKQMHLIAEKSNKTTEKKEKKD
jgi:hypothetical protein